MDKQVNKKFSVETETKVSSHESEEEVKSTSKFSFSVSRFLVAALIIMAIVVVIGVIVLELAGHSVMGAFELLLSSLGVILMRLIPVSQKPDHVASGVTADTKAITPDQKKDLLTLMVEVIVRVLKIFIPFAKK